MLVTTPLGHARRWIWRTGQRGQFASVPLAGGCTATDIVMGKDGKRDERKARRARKAEKQMNRRLHEKEAGQRKQSKRRKHSTASSAVLEISFRSQGVLCGFVPFAQLPADQILSAPVQLDTSTTYLHIPCHGARRLRHQELDPLSCTTTHVLLMIDYPVSKEKQVLLKASNRKAFTREGIRNQMRLKWLAMARALPAAPSAW